MEIKEIIKALLIASPMSSADARQAIESAADCEIELSLAGIAEWLADQISADCDEWGDILPDAAWQAICGLDSAGWSALESGLSEAIAAELRPWKHEIAGMLADEREMAQIRRDAAAIIAAAPAIDWAPLIAAQGWEGRLGQEGRYDRPAARILIALPIAWELAEASGGPSAGLRRAMAEQMANDHRLIALL